MRVCILGPSGRMGAALLAGANEAGAQVVGLVDSPQSPLIGKSIDGVTVTSDLKTGLANAQVYIDFTTPAATAAAAQAAATLGIVGVVGTTGLSPAAETALSALAKRAALVWAPNFSVGVNVLLGLAERAAQILGSDYDLEVFEVHHRNKLDSPSGTALALAEAMARGRGLPASAITTQRPQRAAEARNREQVGIASLRGGDVIGEHSAMFLAEGEMLEFTHRATTRTVFAQGALRAARWASSQPPGRYSMRDVLGL